MNVYNKWGFASNPFQQTALEADETGNRLLIGREPELDRLQQYISTPPRTPTIEGLNGVGKTSLVNVAAYRLYRSFATGNSKALYLPCKVRFQLTADLNIDDFIDDFFQKVASTIIGFRSEWVSPNSFLPEYSAVDRWLNSPLLTSVSAGLHIMQVGLSSGSSSNANTSSGFTRTGFRRLVREWLSELFKMGEEGGVVCVIDNLELLESSANLRQALERLRDEVLTLAGIRTVLCGANGIVLSSVSSSRLSGLLYNPICLDPVGREYWTQIFKSRVAAFERVEGQGYLPLTEAAFITLYMILHYNLRSVLRYADEYCMTIAYGKGAHPVTDDEKNEAFNAWLYNEACTAFNAMDKHLTKRQWRLMKDIDQLGAEVGPSDYADLGFKSPMALSPHLKQLESFHAVTTLRTEEDKRRKIIVLSPTGRLALMYCNGMKIA